MDKSISFALLLLLCQAPWAADDNADIVGYDPVALYVLNNDTAGTALSDVSAPAHGTATIDGDAIIYTADQDYVGEDSFTYTSSGGGGGEFEVKLAVSRNSLEREIGLRLARDPAFAADFVNDLKQELRDDPEGDTAMKLGDGIRELAATDPWFEKRFSAMFRAASIDRAIDLYVFLGDDNLQGTTESGDFNGADDAFVEEMSQHGNNNVLVLNCAVAGSSLLQWSTLDAPRHRSPSYLGAGRRLDWSNECMASIDGILDDANAGASLRGLVVGLGESDAAITAGGGPSALLAGWRQNLSQLLDLYRASYGADVTVLLLDLPPATGMAGAQLASWEQYREELAGFRSYRTALIDTTGIAIWDDGDPAPHFSDTGQQTLASRLVQGFLDPQIPSLGTPGNCSPATPCFPGSDEQVEANVCEAVNFFRRSAASRRILCDQHGNSLHALAAACEDCIDLGSVALAQGRGLVSVTTGQGFTPTFYNPQYIDGRLVEPVPFDNPFTEGEPGECGRAGRESSSFVLAPGRYAYSAESRLAEACDGDGTGGCGLLLSAATAGVDSYKRDLDVAAGECLAVSLGEVSEPPPPPPPPPVSYSTIQSTVFNVSCALSGCHSGSSPAQGMNLSAGVSYGNIVGVASREQPGLLRVNPGNPDASYLLQKISGTAAVGSRMPLGGAPLSPGIIQQVRDWIAQGALNN